MVKKKPSYWLMKSEPDAYSIETLEKEKLLFLSNNEFCFSDLSNTSWVKEIECFY